MVAVFDVDATDGAARAGVLHTAHGDVPTPAFMPVGTKATVKGLDPDELRALGAPILLANTYHLHFRPGEEWSRELGGLHRFMGWDGPILTDSGGFQVFSLRDTILASTTRASRSARSTTAARRDSRPSVAARIQRALGSDIAMCLDVCPPAGVPRAGARGAPCAHDALGRRASARRRARAGQLVFGISQGGTDPELRRRSIGGDRRARLRRLRARRARASARTAR